MAEDIRSRCAVIIAPRDRISTIEKCVRNTLKHSPPGIRMLLVAGGLPADLRRRLEKAFDGRVEMIFPDRFLNTAQARNIGLGKAGTKLAACIDSDVFVRPGWLEPLVRCQAETGAAMVSPIVLDRSGLIHTAGNDLYITASNGKRFGMAELHYANLPMAQSSNIRRREMDFAEVHCHFVDTQKALSLGIYDEHFIEGSDFDSGMTLRAAGEKVMLEPASMVYLYYPPVLNDLVDRGLYLWKWDLAAVTKSFEHFERKWGIDMMTKSNMHNHILMLNHRVGLLTRLFPCALSLAADQAFYRWKMGLSRGSGAWRAVKNKVLGYR